MHSLKVVKPTKDSAVYDFIIKKENEGEPKRVAKIAGLNKFLRIYYATRVYTNVFARFANLYSLRASLIHK